MDRVLRRNESVTSDDPLAHANHRGEHVSLDLPKCEQALAASVLATNLNADAIVVLSRTGKTAKAVSACRPHVPIHVFSPSASVQRRLMLVWGVTPHVVSFSATKPEETVSDALALVRKQGILKKGQRVVIVSDIRTDGSLVMTIQIRTIA